MAEELQQLINKRNIDYGNVDSDADADKPQAAAANTEQRPDSSKLIQADIARWIAERGDIAELGQIYRPHADHSASDLHSDYAGGMQSDLSLLHWRHAATPVQDRDELNQRTTN